LASQIYDGGTLPFQIKTLIYRHQIIQVIPWRKSMNRKETPEGPFRTLVVLGESTVEGGGWLSDTKERWADILWKLLEQAQGH
jgi:hypothetical protein